MSQEKYLFKKERKEKERLKQQRRRKINKMLFMAIGVLVIGGGIFGGWFLVRNYSLPSSESEIISKNGLHWHADLSIKITGKEQEIPASIGLGITERPIHTHDTDGVIHLEFSGLVKEDDIKLGKFFQNWGKKFNQDCIFDKCVGPQGQLEMLVNGELNYEFENYIMQDKDKIEIIFE